MKKSVLSLLNNNGLVLQQIRLKPFELVYSDNKKILRRPKYEKARENYKVLLRSVLTNGK